MVKVLHDWLAINRGEHVGRQPESAPYPRGERARAPLGTGIHFRKRRKRRSQKRVCLSQQASITGRFRQHILQAIDKNARRGGVYSLRRLLETGLAARPLRRQRPARPQTNFGIRLSETITAIRRSGRALCVPAPISNFPAMRQ
jgi:hypothetical protein